MRKSLQFVACIVTIVGGFFLWYCIAANYDYSALAGTYTFRSGEDKCTLHLYPDRRFIQDITRRGRTQTARGEWRRFGEAGMDLSDSFLKLQGQQPGPSGENYGHFEKVLGIFPTLTLDGGPKFRRSLTSFLTRK